MCCSCPPSGRSIRNLDHLKIQAADIALDFCTMMNMPGLGTIPFCSKITGSKVNSQQLRAWECTAIHCLLIRAATLLWTLRTALGVLTGQDTRAFYLLKYL